MRLFITSCSEVLISNSLLAYSNLVSKSAITLLTAETKVSIAPKHLFLKIFKVFICLSIKLIYPKLINGVQPFLLQ